RRQIRALRIVVELAEIGLGRQRLDREPLADQRVARAVLVTGRIELAGAVACLGDAIAGDRMRAQEVRDVAAAAAALLQGPEEVRHAGRIESRRSQDADTDAIRLGLVRPREVDL